jgi:2-polyprenyl-3-methyl-5-hydroxy-6-metoxy-1,4-benzoquinol methylase
MFVKFNAGPAARYVHPRATHTSEQEGDDASNLEVASEASPNYLKWVADLCAPHLGASVLDVGAGTGSVTQHLVEGRYVVATDLTESSVEAMRRRFHGLDSVEVHKADLRTWDPGRRFDSVLMVNVLEHIRDDVGVLSSLQRFLGPGGSIVIYTPALNGLFGRWDDYAGHFRRYSKWRLGEVFRQASLDTVELRYVNLLAIPAWILFSPVMSVDGDARHSLSIWDRTAVPLTRFIESRVRVPIGLNILGVGRARS